MIITLTAVIGNGVHHGKTIREVMDSDPEYIVRWREKIYGLRFDTASSNYLTQALARHEKAKMEMVIFEEEMEDSPF